MENKVALDTLYNGFYRQSFFSRKLKLIAMILFLVCKLALNIHYIFLNDLVLANLCIISHQSVLSKYVIKKNMFQLLCISSS